MGVSLLVCELLRRVVRRGATRGDRGVRSFAGRSYRQPRWRGRFTPALKRGALRLCRARIVRMVEVHRSMCLSLVRLHHGSFAASTYQRRPRG